MSDPALEEKLLSRTRVFDGRLFRVECWDVSLPDGQTARREVVLLPGASAVVAVDDEGRLPLVRQHRIASGLFTWELPAGKLDSPEEDPLACAKRELLEETGLTADRWQPLPVIHPSPAFCSEQIRLYLAQGLHPGRPHADEGEFLECVYFPFQEAFRMCLDGSIRDAKTVIGILMAHALLPSPA